MAVNPRDLPGLKQDDLEPCAKCEKGVMHNGQLMFYRIKATTYMADMSAIQRQHGLELSMGEAAPLARIMGPNRDMAKQVAEREITLCLDCMMLINAVDILEGD